MPSTDKIEIPFCGTHGKGRNLFIDTQQCINYFPELIVDPKGNSKYMLRGSAGLVEFCDLETDVAIRGMVVVGNYLYAVSGTTLYKVTTAGAKTAVSGTITLTSPTVYMGQNGIGTQIGIFGGANGYYYTIATNTLAAIADGDFPGAGTATFRDGFALVNDPDTNAFYKCALNDFSNWDATDYDKEARKAGNIVRMFEDGDDLWVMKELSTGIWYNTGEGSGFPYAKREGVDMDIGLAAAASVASANNAVFWLSNNKEGRGLVMMAVGLQPKVISPSWLNEVIKGYTTISDALGFTYQYDGHIFYELVFPTENASWVYDSVEDLWHQRQSYLSGVLGRHRVQHSVFFDDKLLVGDYDTGQIWEMTPTAYDEGGVGMPAIRTSQTLDQDQRPITFDELHILFSPGVGLSSAVGLWGDGWKWGDGTVWGEGAALNPYAELEWSDDGGNTFPGGPIQIPIGAYEEFDTKAVAYQLGQARNRVFRVTVRSNVKRDIKGAYARVELDE